MRRPLLRHGLGPLVLLLPALCMAGLAHAGAGAAPFQEVHQELDTAAGAHSRDLALTLDACGGAYDRALIGTLVRLRVPATLFVTRKWLNRNPVALRELLEHGDLFELENHGAAHVPAVVGGRVYSLQGPANVAGVVSEVSEGAMAVTQVSGRTPLWYRSAGAVYDASSRQAIAQLGYRIAGFSLNADVGATLPAATVARRLRQAQAGQIIIAHMNKPASGTAQGMALALPELLGRGLHFVKLTEAAGVLPMAATSTLR